MRLIVKSNIRDVERMLILLNPRFKEKAAVMAINKVASKAKTEMVRAIASEFNLKQAEIRSRMQLIRAKRGKIQAVLHPFASKTKRGRSLNLIHFMENKVTIAAMRRRKKKGTHKQLQFKIKKHGGPKTIKGAFIGNKGRTIFQRKDLSDNNSEIQAVSTIDVPQMFSTKRIAGRVIDRINIELPIEINRAGRHVLAMISR